MEEIAKVVQAALKQDILHVDRKLFLLAKGSYGVGIVPRILLFLIDNDMVGAPGGAGIEEQQIMLQLVHYFLMDP